MHIQMNPQRAIECHVITVTCTILHFKKVRTLPVSFASQVLAAGSVPLLFLCYTLGQLWEDKLHIKVSQLALGLFEMGSYILWRSLLQMHTCLEL